MNDNLKKKNIPQYQRLAAIAIIFFSILAAYYKTLDNPFFWDDTYLINDNYFIKDLGNIKQLFTVKYFSQPIEISYRPLTTLSLMADYALWNEHSGGYHYFNLILHFFNSLIVLTLLARLTRRFALSAGVALLFALHPLQTEAINLITFREDMLCFLFAGSSFLLYLRHRDRGGAATLALSLLAAALAMFSKETAVVLPAVILSYEYFASDRQPGKTSWGYALLFAVPAVIYIFLRFGPMKGPAEHIIYHDNSAYKTSLFMVQALARYLNLLFWPARQCVDQPFPDSPDLFSAATIASAVLVAAFIVLAVVFHIKRRPVLFGFLWFILFFLPVSNIIPIGVIMAERYMYIPSVGFFLAVAFILDFLFLSEDRPVKSLTPAVLAVFIFVAAAASLFLTYDRNNSWENRIVFWEDACDCSPRSARAAVNLGIAYLDDNRLEEAAETLIRAVRLASFGRFEDIRYGTLYRGLSNLGIVAARQGKLHTAVKFFSEAAELKPDAPLTYLNLGVTLMRMGRLGDAEASFRKCLDVDPNNQHAHLYLAVVLWQTGRRGEAIWHTDSILKLDPDSERALRLKQHLIWETQNLDE